MRAMVCHALSPDRSGLRFESDWPEPAAPGPHDVTVGLTTAALNYPDVLMLAGGYQYAPPLPFIPAVEGCGTVIAAGSGAASLVGQRVIVGARHGCLAERITVPATSVRPVPDGLTDAEAAAHTVAMLTAYVALVRRGRVQAGERVAIAGAGGGTGLAAVAVARALGASVVAIASTEAKCAAAKLAGASATFRGARGDRVDIDPVDVAFDPVGGTMTGRLLSVLERGGRYLVIGFVGGIAPVAFDLLRRDEVEIIGVRAGEYARRDPAGGIADLAAIDGLAAAGLRPNIGLSVLLEDADTAFSALATGTLIGKAVIQVEQRSDAPAAPLT